MDIHTLNQLGQEVFALDMLMNNHLPSRLEQPVQLFRHLCRLRHGAQHLHTCDSINTPKHDAILFEFLQIFYSARNDGVHIAQPMFLNGAPQGIMQMEIRLDAVDSVDLRNVVSRQLVTASGSYFKNSAASFSDEVGDTCLCISGRNRLI